jgi:hydroxymethylglutaryl-CoA reductase (NADPH)
MADDTRHREGKDTGAKTGRNNEKDTLIHLKLKDGSLKLYEIEKELSPFDAIRVRREYLEGETGSKLRNVGTFSIDIERVVKRNCENMIGAVQVPVGVAGPIRINGGLAQGRYWLPLATTEGALVASVNRAA